MIDLNKYRVRYGEVIAIRLAPFNFEDVKELLKDRGEVEIIRGMIHITIDGKKKIVNDRCRLIKTPLNDFILLSEKNFETIFEFSNNVYPILVLDDDKRREVITYIVIKFKKVVRNWMPSFMIDICAQIMRCHVDNIMK